jgi:hypothetical protein
MCSAGDPHYITTATVIGFSLSFSADVSRIAPRMVVSPLSKGRGAPGTEKDRYGTSRNAVRLMQLIGIDLKEQ